MSSAAWISKSVLAAALVLLVCASAKPWLPTDMLAPGTATRDGSLIAINRYLSEPDPDVVLLGSSLTARIKEEYFATLRMRNLAIGGGSPLTGLQIILEAHKRIPKVILVETNLLSKEIDENLVKRYSSAHNELYFRPIRMAVAAYENWRHAPPNRKDSSVAMRQVLDQPPHEYLNRVYLERVAKGFDQDLAGALQENVNKLAHLVSSARSLGARVLLFELPYADQISRTRLAQDTQRYVRGRFHNSDEWLTLHVSEGELRWPDGLHMDERSAMLAARAIEESVKQVGEAH